MKLTTIGERIRMVRTRIAKQSQESFAASVCMTQSNLSMIEQCHYLPSIMLLYWIHTIWRINLNWLLTGEGEMVM
ncbi:helix-turn-helix domain-containing protein [Cytophagaceae bacterium DM2B3-1]|uniref:Helix-turn-helix domain-containing protein n=1 Tax=Xanthocytophaga flava TaxID=3048013 RepID=A0AAE3QII4_9BACT|nr:helix-turn-helix domain-containing protein [Xanthocytophaga flavus]MDJ1466602.1 helix-turn-helix domain-containing protein [Xanthocytophaga flavus]MDJ1479256.1 helix-turn-helix domain-containing protein [Xanthocytophaga flavus]MDJ1492598.1 helix-turn-helix domain-containing protein [Xanthocytophaga flavus]